MNSMATVTFDSADSIDTLPTDQTVPSHNEIQIMDTLFQQQQSTMERIFTHSKDILLAGILFAILSLQPIDELVQKLIPITQKSSYILIMVKGIAFMVIYFVLKYQYLVRKK